MTDDDIRDKLNELTTRANRFGGLTPADKKWLGDNADLITAYFNRQWYALCDRLPGDVREIINTEADVNGNCLSIAEAFKKARKDDGYSMAAWCLVNNIDQRDPSLFDKNSHQRVVKPDEYSEPRRNRFPARLRRRR